MNTVDLLRVSRLSWRSYKENKNAFWCFPRWLQETDTYSCRFKDLPSNKIPTVPSPRMSSANFGANIVLFLILSPIALALSLGTHLEVWDIGRELNSTRRGRKWGHIPLIKWFYYCKSKENNLTTAWLACSVLCYTLSLFILSFCLCLFPPFLL